MKQIEYFAYTGQLEVWLASKDIDLVSAAPTPEPIYEFVGRDGHLRISNQKVDAFVDIPRGGRWAVQQPRGYWVVYESTGALGLSRVDRVHTRAVAEALIRERPALPVQPTKD